jgi:hypothetical protein
VGQDPIRATLLRGVTLGLGAVSAKGVYAALVWLGTAQPTIERRSLAILGTAENDNLSKDRHRHDWRTIFEARESTRL